MTATEVPPTMMVDPPPLDGITTGTPFQVVVWPKLNVFVPIMTPVGWF